MLHVRIVAVFLLLIF